MLLQTSFFFVCVVILPLHGTNACVKAINGKRWHLRDRAIFIGGMGPLQNSMGRLLFSVTFKHGANTFFFYQSYAICGEVVQICRDMCIIFIIGHIG